MIRKLCEGLQDGLRLSLMLLDISPNQVILDILMAKEVTDMYQYSNTIHQSFRFIASFDSFKCNIAPTRAVPSPINPCSDCLWSELLEDFVVNFVEFFDNFCWAHLITCSLCCLFNHGPQKWIHPVGDFRRLICSNLWSTLWGHGCLL